MRRTSAISRLKTLVLATAACVLLALVAPLIIAPRAVDEPYSGYSVLASPRDLYVITKPTRLSLAPDLTCHAAYSTPTATPPWARRFPGSCSMARCFISTPRAWTPRRRLLTAARRRAPR